MSQSNIGITDRISPNRFIRAEVTESLSIPFFEGRVMAGFGNPTEHFLEKSLDLNDLCNVDPDTTYFVEVESDSMIGDYITPGCILVVDKKVPVRSGRIIVAWLNGVFTVKRIQIVKKMVVLWPSNEDYLPVYVHKHDDFRLFGVVTYWFHKAPTRYDFPV